MTSYGKAIVIMLWVVIGLAALAIYTWYGWAPDHEQRLSKAAMDGAGVVLMIGAVSVGIERAIEYLWTASAMAVGSFWPVSVVGKFVTDLSDDVGRTMAPHIEQAQAIVKGLKDANAIGDSVVTQVNTRLANATTQVDQLKAAVKHSQGALTYASAAADVANNVSVELQGLVDAAHAAANTPADRLTLAKALVKAQAGLSARRAYPNGKPAHDGVPAMDVDAVVEEEATKAVAAWEAALGTTDAEKDQSVREYLHKDPFIRFGEASAALTTSITSVTDFLASFKDNPGRRMLSLQLGILGGLLVALFSGLDVFAGVSNEGAAPGSTLAAATVGGILFTGILMGLGSSPTHEVIRVLQESKKARKAATASEVDQDAAAGTGEIAATIAGAVTGAGTVTGAGPAAGGGGDLAALELPMAGPPMAGAPPVPPANATLESRGARRMIRVR